jgi:hypothetical protein
LVYFKCNSANYIIHRTFYHTFQYQMIQGSIFQNFHYNKTDIINNTTSYDK